MIRNNKSLRNPKLGVSYVRVSTHVQEQSILAQNQRLDRHVLLNETILVRKFEDEAKSGRKLLVKRPGGWPRACSAVTRALMWRNWASRSTFLPPSRVLRLPCKL